MPGRIRRRDPNGCAADIVIVRCAREGTGGRVEREPVRESGTVGGGGGEDGALSRSVSTGQDEGHHRLVFVRCDDLG